MRVQSDANDPLGARDDRGRDLDLGALAAGLWRRRLRVLVPTLIALIGSVIVVQLIPPKYNATADVKLEPQEAAWPTSDARSADRNVIDEQAVASEVQVMQSRDLALRAIKKLNLVGNPEFDPGAAGVGPLSQVLMVLGLAKNPLDKPPEERVLEHYAEALTVYPRDKSRVITVEFSSRDADLSARAANTIAELYIAMQQTARQGQSADASQALSPQIAAMSEAARKADQVVEEYRARNSLFIGQNNATLATQQLAETNSQLSAARAQQAEAQAKAKLIRDLLKSGKPIDIPDVTDNDLIRRLIEQRVNLKAQLALESRTLLANHPRIKELNAQLADLQGQIATEAQKTIRTLENDAKLAGGRVETLTQQLEQRKTQAAASNEQEVQLRALERDAKAKRDLLEAYLARFRDTSARSLIADAPANAVIVSRAVPATTPYFPRKLPMIFIATMATFLLSLAVAATGELMSGRAFTAPRPAWPAPPADLETGPGRRPPEEPPPAPPSGPPRPPQREEAGGGVETVSRPASPPPADRVAAYMASLGEPHAPAAPRPDESGAIPTSPGRSTEAQLFEPLGVEADLFEPLGAPAGAEAQEAAHRGTGTPPVEAPPAAALQAGPPAADAPADAADAAEADAVLDLEETARRLMLQGRPPQSVLFAATGQRAMVAAVATHFARTLADEGARTVLVDLGAGSTASIRRGLGELLTGEASFVDVIERDEFSRLHLIAGGGSVVGANIGEQAVQARMRLVFEALASTYEAIVFDGGAVLDGEGERWAPIIAACTRAFVVAGAADPAAAQETRHALSGLGATHVEAVAAPAPHRLDDLAAA